MKGFKKFCLSNAFDGTDMLWNGSENKGSVKRG